MRIQWFKKKKKFIILFVKDDFWSLLKKDLDSSSSYSSLKQWVYQIIREFVTGLVGTIEWTVDGPLTVCV